jgi:bile acid:Na+ symporter, BASS family
VASARPVSALGARHVPAGAVGRVGYGQGSPGVEIGLLVLAVSAGAPLLPRKLMKIGDGAYVFSLVLTSSLLAVFLVPTWLAAIGPVLDYPLSLRPERVALVLGKSFLLPLVLGMAVRRLYPAVADRVGNRLMAIAGLILMGCALALMIMHWDILVVARGLGVLTLGSLIAISLAIGHLLGGPSEDDRTALAIACGTRHIGIAVLVAASVPGPRTSVLVAFYILMSAVISIPYCIGAGFSAHEQLCSDASSDDSRSNRSAAG